MNRSSLQSFAESKINRFRPGIKLYWWRPEDRSRRNFGDEVTRDIIRHISGLDVRWTRVQDCDMVGAGSVLEIVTANRRGREIAIWGSGFIDDGALVEAKGLNICAVRGKLTRDRLSAGFDTVLGDPGLLAGLAYKPHNQSTDIGIVLHYQDIGNGEIVESLQKKGFRVISPYNRPADVAGEISECQAVFSTSLHGLIFSDSYGVPNFRIKISELKGGDFKFNDYYSATDRGMVEVDARSLFQEGPTGGQVAWALDKFRPIVNISEIQHRLLNSFPYQINYGAENDVPAKKHGGSV